MADKKKSHPRHRHICVNCELESQPLTGVFSTKTDFRKIIAGATLLKSFPVKDVFLRINKEIRGNFVS